MELDFNEIAAALNEWERIGAKGPVYEAARVLVDAPRMWWCNYRRAAVEKQPSDCQFAACMGDCGPVRVVKEVN